MLTTTDEKLSENLLLVRSRTAEETRQELSDMMRQADDEFNRGDYITEKEMWAVMGDIRASIPRK